MLIDTHCHIHEADYPLQIDEVLLRASEANVEKMICVGTTLQSSSEAIEFSKLHDHVYASVGVHPHESKDGYDGIASLAKKGAVAIGEIGLDYYYDHSPRDVQIAAFEAQLQIAVENNLPVIFHVREAFDDFWPIFDKFEGVRGVLHSFTDTPENLDKAFKRGLYVGVNGISTFTKDTVQQAMYTNIPLDRLLLETDAPFLAPLPHRGTTNEPAYIELIAKYHAEARGIGLDDVAEATSNNALTLFGLRV